MTITTVTYLTKASLASFAGMWGATHWSPITTPKAPPHVEKRSALGSILIFWYKMVNAAQFMPTDCVNSDISACCKKCGDVRPVDAVKRHPYLERHWVRCGRTASSQEMPQLMHPRMLPRPPCLLFA